MENDAIVVIDMLDPTGIDVIDVSGGTYFPGAPSSSDRASTGPYFAEFGRRARARTGAAVMVTGGVKTRADAAGLVTSGAADVVGLARTLALDPDLPNRWLTPSGGDPEFPRFASTVPGGITGWYTARLADIAAGVDAPPALSPEEALERFDRRAEELAAIWREQG